VYLGDCHRWNALTRIFPIVLFLIASPASCLGRGMSTDTLVNAVVTVFPSDPSHSRRP